MRVVVLHGPGVDCHRPSLERWCAAQEGAAVELVVCGDAASLLRELATPAPVILAPGALRGDAEIQAAAVARATGPLIWFELEAALGPPPAALAQARVQTVRGRGIDGHRWALRSLLERAAWPWVTHAYGDGRDQVGDLRLPAGTPPADGFPVVALLHGGAWRAQWERDLMDALAVDLARRGYASWNVEYRRVGEGGGWPQTFDDVAAAIDLLPQLEAPLDLARVALLGHSAGGHLALWAAARDAAPPPAARAPESFGRSATRTLRCSLVVSLAGLPDMAETSRRATYDDGATALLGGRPDEHPDRYALASPHRLLPLGVRQLLVHGTADQPDNVDMNRLYAERAAAAGDWVELLELEGVEHFAPIEPRSAAWATIASRLEALL